VKVWKLSFQGKERDKDTHFHCFFFLAEPEFELRALCLLGRCAYHLSYSASPSFVIFFSWSRVLWMSCWGLALNWDLPDLCFLSS
jgi:hypothetical protein